uniref:Protein kinase domain-containing protein n=1 Tax=Panagrellus redivivus TaxID=6233 RepID=A0A7E4VVI1_PANRE
MSNHRQFVMVAELQKFLIAFHRTKKIPSPIESKVVEPVTISESERRDKLCNAIWRILNEIETRINTLNESNPHQFIEEWSIIAWAVLSVITRLDPRGQYYKDPFNCCENRHFFDKLLVVLNNLSAKSLSPDPPYNVPRVLVQHYQETYQFHLNALDNLEVLQSGLCDQHLITNVEDALTAFLKSLKTLNRQYGAELWKVLRREQVKKMTTYGYVYHGFTNVAVNYYSTMAYMLGKVAVKIQIIRNNVHFPRKVFPNDDYLQNILETYFRTLEIIAGDSLICIEPSQNAIMVTNNLFPVKIETLCKMTMFASFSLQIVSEEVASQIQQEMLQRQYSQRPAEINKVSSAALLAMKPATGVKRNNATANESGGNTAHKKSDVNSKEWITIEPSLDAESCSWQAAYPHLLCTTRQKDSILDSRSNTQTGKRPIFYFHVKAEVYSPAGGMYTAHTLSMPFSIATRRNQDCQVQRMMSSYTATCFWLYGTKNIEGLLLSWNESGIPWSKFKHLYSKYFSMNAEVKRQLTEHDLEILSNKMSCDECRGAANLTPKDGEPQCTFKNVLCPHLRYSFKNKQGSNTFSVWRGMLELLHLFSDQRTDVKHFWESGVLQGFLGIKEINALLSNQNSAIIVYLSFVVGGCVCMSIVSNGKIMHLEPLDLKKLQSKPLADYIRDMVMAEKIEFYLNDKHEWADASHLPTPTQGANDNSSGFKEITSNIMHTSNVSVEETISYTPLRIAVVTCKQDYHQPNEYIYENNEHAGPIPHMPSLVSTPSVMPPPSSTAYFSEPYIDTEQNFATRLESLMHSFGKSREDVMGILNPNNLNMYTASHDVHDGRNNGHVINGHLLNQNQNYDDFQFYMPDNPPHRNFANYQTFS